MTKSITPHLILIQESIAAIKEYRPNNLHELEASPVTWDAILMRLQVIGESLSQMRQIDEEKFAAMADDSWHNIIGLRNIISHGYLSINAAAIWENISPASLDSFERTITALRDRPAKS